MNSVDWKPVGTALLGTWPSQVANWGPEGIAAYIAELQARGVTPERALLAIRAYDPDADFPPSAAKLAQVARRDPGAPTGLELVQILWGPGGVLHARAESRAGVWAAGERDRADEQAQLDKATEFHPRVVAFIHSVGLKALRDHDPRGEQYGPANQNWICKQWDAFVEVANERGVASMLAGKTLDPLAAFRGRLHAVPEIEKGDAA